MDPIFEHAPSRESFLQLTEHNGGQLTSIVLEELGPQGEELSIDFARFGPSPGVAQRLFLLTAGVHGVEAPKGCHQQRRVLSDLPRLPRDTSMVLVHCANPYGFAWGRRVTSGNVDLNRTFLSRSASRTAPDLYCVLNDFLNPESPLEKDVFFLKLACLIARHGYDPMKRAIAGGQYHYEKGLFFGGSEMDPTARLLMEAVSAQVGDARLVVHIDTHTGLGRFGREMLLTSHSPDGPSFKALASSFGKRFRHLNDEYAARGSLNVALMRAISEARVLSVTQEVGTYNPLRILHALREENRAHHYAGSDPGHPAKGDLRRMFALRDRRWWARAEAAGVNLMGRALRLLETYS